MPSPRKRIGFLPSEEVHEIIEKLCTANEFSQSKVTGLLVEEALRSRGVLNGSYGQNQSDKDNFVNLSIAFLSLIWSPDFTTNAAPDFFKIAAEVPFIDAIIGFEECK